VQIESRRKESNLRPAVYENEKGEKTKAQIGLDFPPESLAIPIKSPIIIFIISVMILW
jgi:hypothetical protein